MFSVLVARQRRYQIDVLSLIFPQTLERSVPVEISPSRRPSRMWLPVRAGFSVSRPTKSGGDAGPQQ